MGSASYKKGSCYPLLPRQPPAGYSKDDLFFSSDYSALFLHDEVKGAPENVRRELLVAQLYVYLHFTVVLEMGPVNEVANLLRQPSFLPWLPRAMKEYAHHVYTDEAWHADFSATLISEAIEVTGVPDVTTHPAFLDTLKQLELAEEPEFRPGLFMSAQFPWLQQPEM